jgi:hypothetical protein
LAFLLNSRAATTGGDEAIADRVQARRLRVRVLAICDDLLKNTIKGESANDKAVQEYLIRAIRAEALCGLQRLSESERAFVEAKNMDPKPEKGLIESDRETARHTATPTGCRHPNEGTLSMRGSRLLAFSGMAPHAPREISTADPQGLRRARPYGRERRIW